MSQAGQENVLVEVDLGTRFSLQRIELHWRSNFSVFVLPLSVCILACIPRLYICVCVRACVRACVCVCARAPVSAFVCVFVYAFLGEHEGYER